MTLELKSLQREKLLISGLSHIMKISCIVLKKLKGFQLFKKFLANISVNRDRNKYVKLYKCTQVIYRLRFLALNLDSKGKKSRQRLEKIPSHFMFLQIY